MNGTTIAGYRKLRRLDADLQPGFLGHRRGGESGERDRRRQVGHDAEIEDEHVADQQWHAELEQRRPGERGGDDVVRDGRDSHAEHQAGEHGQHQRQEEIVLADRR